MPEWTLAGIDGTKGGRSRRLYVREKREDKEAFGGRIWPKGRAERERESEETASSQLYSTTTSTRSLVDVTSD